MPSPAERSKRSSAPVLVSLALHGSFFASAFLFGTHVIIRVIEPVKTQAVAKLAFSGGSHAITDRAAHIPIRSTHPRACTKGRCRKEDGHSHAGACSQEVRRRINAGASSWGWIFDRHDRQWK